MLNLRKIDTLKYLRTQLPKCKHPMPDFDWDMRGWGKDTDPELKAEIDAENSKKLLEAVDAKRYRDCQTCDECGALKMVDDMIAYFREEAEKALPEMFEVQSGAVVVSDPCYEPDTWCAGTISNVLNGQFYCDLEFSDEDSWGMRVAEIQAIHEGYSLEGGADWQRTDIDVGVDSGQAGIFDADYYLANGSEGEVDDEDSFYGACCKATLGDFKAGSIHGRGFVSSAGFGDGSYDAYTLTDKGKVVGIKIVYIGPEDHEDDEDEEE